MFHPVHGWDVCAEAKADALAAELAFLHRHRYGMSDGCGAYKKPSGKILALRVKASPWA